MESDKQVKLTSVEINFLWTTYMSDSATICILSHFLNKVEDKEVKPVIAYALQLAKNHVQKITEIFKEEHYAVPHGFKIEEDVDLSAPRLYSDSYFLNYIYLFSRIGIRTHSMSLSLVVRKDCTNFFKECVLETIKLFEMSKDVLLSKGLFIRSPHLPKMEAVEFVEKQRFLEDLLGEKRPLTAPEITQLHTNFQRNALGAATLIGFSQVAKLKDVIQYLVKGKELAEQYCEIFGTKLKNDDLPMPMIWNSEVTDSTQYVFSDKLMMFVTSGLTALGIEIYGYSIATSVRKDLGVMYNKILLETQQYGAEGAKIMIENRWLEQPPTAPDRNALAKKNTEF